MVPSGSTRVLVVDDCVQTGGTLTAVAEAAGVTSGSVVTLVCNEFTRRRRESDGWTIDFGTLLPGETYPMSYATDLFCVRDFLVDTAVRFADGTSTSYSSGGDWLSFLHGTRAEEARSHWTRTRDPLADLGLLTRSDQTTYERNEGIVRLPAQVLPAPPPCAYSLVATLTRALGHGVFYTVSVLYFAHTEGMSVRLVGLGLTIAAVAAMAVSVPAGHLADILGPRGVSSPAFSCKAWDLCLRVHGRVRVLRRRRRAHRARRSPPVVRPSAP